MVAIGDPKRTCAQSSFEAGRGIVAGCVPCEEIGEAPHKHSRARGCLRWFAQNRRIFGGTRAMVKRRAGQARSAERSKKVFCPPNPNELDSTHLTVTSRAMLCTTYTGM